MTDNARAPRKKSRRGRSSRIGKLLLMLTLLLVGAFLGVLAYVGFRGGVDLDALLADTQPEQPTNRTPKYSFYDDLPRPPDATTAPTDGAAGGNADASAEPAVPPIALISRQSETAPSPAAGEPPPAAANASGDYMVQAGAFARRSDADRRKASLALLGVQASIERGEVDGGAVYRVRIGPFTSAEQARSLRQRLEQDNIQSFTVKRE